MVFQGIFREYVLLVTNGGRGSKKWKIGVTSLMDDPFSANLTREYACMYTATVCDSKQLLVIFGVIMLVVLDFTKISIAVCKVSVKQ